MAAAGAGAICVRCTEFSSAAERVSASVPVFDALDLSIDATVRFARGEDPATQAAPAVASPDGERETT